MLLLAFAVPLSFAIDFDKHQLSFPIEILLLGLGIALIFRFDFRNLHRDPFLKHPISKLSILYLVWMVITIFFSSDKLVSTKYFLVTAAHWWVFFIGLGKTLPKIGWQKWISAYLLGFMLVCIYAVVHYAQYDFRPDASVLMARPFYSDHALFGAAAVMIVFLLLSFKVERKLSVKHSFLFIALVVCLAVIFFSRSRAVQLSLLIGLILVLYHLIFDKMIKVLLVGFLFVGFILTVLSPKIIDQSWQSPQPLRESLDVSSLERINRYSCAWRMFLDRPLTGYGVGTFPQEYLAYQRPHEMTRISVTTPRQVSGKPHGGGRGGGCHSEYLQVLSEQGLPGFTLWWLLVISAIVYGVRLATSSSAKIKGVAVLVAVYSLLFHYLVNNLQHSEEIAILFWSCLAWLVQQDGQNFKGKSA